MYSNVATVVSNAWLMYSSLKILKIISQAPKMSPNILVPIPLITLSSP